jgi:quercetin dioxygenase-like cupin family protein
MQPGAQARVRSANDAARKGRKSAALTIDAFWLGYDRDPASEEAFMFKESQQHQPILRFVTLFAVAIAAIVGLSARRSSAQSGAGTSHPANFSHSLPQLDGSHLRAIVVEVNYAPGEADKPHSHPCTVIGYVAQGTIRFQVKGGPEGVYKAGESFYEAPNGVHQVSANASDKEPAKLIAFFICDHETPLTVPPVDSHAGHQTK